jgi:hypothetical protein
MSANPPEDKVNVSDWRDIQGILALGFAVGWHVVAISVIALKLVDPSTIVTGEVGLVNAIVAYYFGQKSQQ